MIYAGHIAENSVLMGRRKPEGQLPEDNKELLNHGSLMSVFSSVRNLN